MEKQIIFTGDLDNAISVLLAAKERGEKVWGNFNGHVLHSDTASVDSIYLEVTGYTKVEFEKRRNELIEESKKERENAQQKALENIPNWIQMGKTIIFPERYEEWEKCVKIRANDLFYGLEIDASLKIMQALENGVTVEEAAKMLEGQSGLAADLIRRIVFDFSSRGPEFWEGTVRGDMTPEDMLKIEEKKQENIQLAQANAQKAEEGNKKHM